MTEHTILSAHLRAGLIAALMLALGTTASAQGISVTITNDTSHDLRVTVYDENSRNPHGVISNGVINGFASITVPVSVDESGRAHISWSATTLGKDMRRCAHRDKPGLSDGDAVHVWANERCGSS